LSEPAVKKYFEENGLRLYYNEALGEIMVTDDDDINENFLTFIRIFVALQNNLC